MPLLSPPSLELTQKIRIIVVQWRWCIVWLPCFPQPLLVLLNADGSLAQNLNYMGGPRQNQLTTITPLNGHWILGGMVNGPGTHSGDSDHNLIVADGFVRDGSGLPPVSSSSLKR